MESFDAIYYRWQATPKWVLITGAIVIGAGGYLLYRYYTNLNSSTNQTQQWNKSAVNYLTSQGYSQSDAQSAVNAYSGGQSLTPSQVSLIAAAIGSVGTPDSVQTNSAVTAQMSAAQPPPGGLAGASGTSGQTSGQTGSSVAYWNVPVGTAGWSTTFSGIGSQFGVSPATVQQTNPNLSNTLWGKLPYGAIVKVPRNPGTD